MMLREILLPIDLSHAQCTVELINMAVGLAQGQPMKVHLLYVDQSLIHRAGYPHLSQSSYAAHRQQAEQGMADFLDALPEPLQGVSHCCEGVAHDQILETAEKLGVDAIVMMARKPGLRSYFIGSTAERVVRHAHCSVFIVREPDAVS
ncbi:MAG: universal stress protein [Marinobacterium sp.]|nr:universal stress protein [Marinobacterium sp.]